MLGTGVYQVFKTPRGGGAIELEADFNSISFGRNPNTWGSATINIPVVGVNGSGCCEFFDNTEPWRDEIAIYRNSDLVFVGPVVRMSLGASGGQVQARDLFYHFEKRWIEEDVKVTGDAADIFRRVFDIAYGADTSINMTLHTRRSGFSGVRIYEAAKTQRAADAMRELARTALDFITIGRELLAGGIEELTSSKPFIIHSHGLTDISAEKDGERLFTDVIVFGSSDTSPEGRPAHGRATRNADYYGLLQESFAELLINDTDSANQNALARLDQMHPIPRRYSVTFAPEADPDFDAFIPGRLVDMRVGGGDDCIEVLEEMRLASMTVNVSASDSGVTETISGEIIPVGFGEES